MPVNRVGTRRSHNGSVMHTSMAFYGHPLLSGETGSTNVSNSTSDFHKMQLASLPFRRMVDRNRHEVAGNATLAQLKPLIHRTDTHKNYLSRNLVYFAGKQ